MGGVNASAIGSDRQRYARGRSYMMARSDVRDAIHLDEVMSPHPIVGITTVRSRSLRPGHHYTFLQCQRTGLTITQYNNGSIPQGTAAQLSEETSGNPNSSPNRRILYLGVNFAPAGFHISRAASITTFQIKDEIGVIPTCWYCRICANRQPAVTATRSCASRKPEA